MGVTTLSLVNPAKRATSPPGVDLHPDASSTTWQGYIEDAFWTAVLKGAIIGYTLDADTHEIVPAPPNTTEMPGELGMLVVEFTALNVISGDLMNLQTQFSVAAGPVKFEYQRSAQVLVMVLKNIQEQISLSLMQIGKLGYVNTAILDGVIDRTINTAFNSEWWIR